MQTKFSAVLITLALLHWATGAVGQVILNEVGYSGRIEIKNTGSSSVNPNGYFLCNATMCKQLNEFPRLCPFLPGNLSAGAKLTIETDLVTTSDGEIALFSSSNTSDTAALLGYVQWGSAGHPREALAVAAGMWPAGEFMAPMTENGSLEYDGNGSTPADWELAYAPSFCEENGTGCQVIAGIIETDDSTTVCINDGIDNFIFIDFESNLSDSILWVFSDAEGVIEAISNSGGFNLEGMQPGTSYIRLVGYKFALIGMEIGADLDSLAGCFDFSDNVIEINKLECATATKEQRNPLPSFTISPNPVTHQLRIGDFALTSNSPLTIRLVNSQGSMVFEKTLTQSIQPGDELIDLSNLPSGIYWVSVSEGPYANAKKFVKL